MFHDPDFWPEGSAKGGTQRATEQSLLLRLISDTRRSNQAFSVFMPAGAGGAGGVDSSAAWTPFYSSLIIPKAGDDQSLS